MMMMMMTTTTVHDCSSRTVLLQCDATLSKAALESTLRHLLLAARLARVLREQRARNSKLLVRVGFVNRCPLLLSTLRF
jgi:hypothetical protein